MPLGTEVGLGLRDIVFDVDPASPRKKGTPIHPHNFWPVSIVAQLVFRDKVARVTRRVAQPFNRRASLFPNTALLSLFLQLCATKFHDKVWHV